MSETNPVMASESERFRQERQAAIRGLGENSKLKQIALDFTVESAREKYSYNFTWMGLPVLQYPTDLIAMQQLIWQIKPKAIVETGVARGGSLVFYSSLLELIEPEGTVVGVDIEIREPNRKAIEGHPLAKRIRLVEGSSIDPATVAAVAALVGQRSPVIVCLDSHHSHDHVLEELNLYSPLVSSGSYLVVFDTAIEYVPEECVFGKPWGKGNSPASAVKEFLQTNQQFAVDEQIDHQLLISVAPGGYLRKQ